MATAGDIAIDPNEINDSNTAFDSDLSIYTQSLRSSVLQGVTENGRKYHSYRAVSNYLAPEDDQEQDRLELQHEAFRINLKNDLLLAPVKYEDVKEVLDLGAGTGTWAIEYADAHPHTQVTGTDISAMQPSVVPPNAKFVVDDFEEDWLFKQKFDVVHGRMLATTFADPVKLFRKARDALQPGGWIELNDLVMPWRSDDGTIPEGGLTERWNKLLVESIRKGINREIGWAEQYKAFLEEAGFVNVEEKIFKWPLNTWPKDEEMKLLGKITACNVLTGLEGFSLRPMMGFLGMSREEVEELLVGVRKDIMNPSIHAYIPIYVVYGQKPAS